METKGTKYNLFTPYIIVMKENYLKHVGYLNSHRTLRLEFAVVCS